MCIRDRVYDVNYDRYTSYTENLNDDKGADNGGYTLDKDVYKRQGKTYAYNPSSYTFQSHEGKP